AELTLLRTIEYCQQREAFGRPISKFQVNRHKIVDMATKIEAARQLNYHCADLYNQGINCVKEISMAKIVVSETLHKVVDTALQLNGARGYSKDTPLEWIYRYARQARLVDGASEVHKMVLARYLMDQGDAFWQWDAADAPRKALV
ncbi:MAG: acyl-CoA dehydrogenase, partial [Achromobacter sp.]|nr:acyl-CoA dehydrogenase [Achromobacter sp.]